MYTSMLSACLRGLEAVPVQVEVDVSDGMPGFYMVGYVSAQVKEAQDRVRTALRHEQIRYPPRKVTINLSPGDLPKSGTAFDLPIAGAILEALGCVPVGTLNGILVAGELGLDGSVHGIRGVLSMVLLARALGCRACMVPMENLQEAAAAGFPVIGVTSLHDFVEHARKREWKAECPHIQIKEEQKGYPDFSDVRGQEGAKRAALLAAAGFHNLLLMGPPGSGKSMIARRICGILPPLTREEVLEVTQIYSAAGLLPPGEAILAYRPFRAPHHSVSPAALAGGGRNPVPGEISLAHRGVLFLDELPEMERKSLELLRQPLEEREIWIVRTGGRFRFPAGFLLTAAMNPCPCGYYPDRNRCSCSESEIFRYQSRLSRPLLDRFDLCAATDSLTYEEIRKEEGKASTTSKHLKKQVEIARTMQQERFSGEPFRFNGEIPSREIQKYCITDSRAERLLEAAFSENMITGRGCHRILRTARTAADLDESTLIREEHIAEAIGYRMMDGLYGGGKYR